MARRAELFVRECCDEEAAHLLKQARRGKNAVVRHRAMLLFASFQGQSVSQISSMFQASATHVACCIPIQPARHSCSTGTVESVASSTGIARSSARSCTTSPRR